MQPNFVQLPDLVSNGYYQLVADPGGTNLSLGVTGGGALVCQNAPFGNGRQGKWVITDAGSGYWYVRTAAPVTTGGPVNLRLTHLDSAGGNPILSTYVSGSENQQWSIVQEGSVYRIRPRADSTRRLAATGDAAPVLELDGVNASASAGWMLVPTDPH
jgi:hypothetical protein